MMEHRVVIGNMHMYKVEKEQIMNMLRAERIPFDKGDERDTRMIIYAGEWTFPTVEQIVHESLASLKACDPAKYPFVYEEYIWKPEVSVTYDREVNAHTPIPRAYIPYAQTVVDIYAQFMREYPNVLWTPIQAGVRGRDSIDMIGYLNLGAHTSTFDTGTTLRMSCVHLHTSPSDGMRFAVTFEDDGDRTRDSYVCSMARRFDEIVRNAAEVLELDMSKLSISS